MSKTCGPRLACGGGLNDLSISTKFEIFLSIPIEHNCLSLHKSHFFKFKLVNTNFLGFFQIVKTNFQLILDDLFLGLLTNSSDSHTIWPCIIQ
ncbi:hypothetical protein BpHYR1_037440 [Brachionus plicatilis]|uniref:Uncharacterized protein n=1 Tax=Brachionus plicatilis TaxID=10195 RepID=A0A3M7P6X4_BRAPC|nr:hypothetical protein BpHYR1_037440 [Brachionus plicatilis]